TVSRFVSVGHRQGPRLLLALVATAALVAPAPRAARGDGPASKDPALAARIRAGLLSASAPDREKALVDLASRVEFEPAACVDAPSGLREVLRLRGGSERARVARLLLKIPGEESAAMWWALLDPRKEEDDRVLAAAVDAVADRASDPALAKRLLEHARDPK